jgi:GNAT superfamily N-acetyltransferase
VVSVTSERTLPIDIIDSELDGLVLDAWLRSNRRSDWVRGVDSSVYIANHTTGITTVCDVAQVKRAVWREHPDQHYGFVVYEPPDENDIVVHYLFVKKPFREYGIARRLLESTGWQPNMRIIATHRTWVVDSSSPLAKKYNVAFNPYLFLQYAGVET